MTQKKSTKPYGELAAKITESRMRLGLSQTELAAELGLKQQAISRWEAGTHRPSVDQVPALAKLIEDESSTLMTLAGYGQPVTSALSTLFPVEALPPDVFERFVEALLGDLYPEAEVNILGSRGHAQKGSDVIVTYPDGRVLSFQCKRVERFGLADIEKAVADHTLDADRKFLVLSKIATPAAIETVTAHPGWGLWDKQVLTRKVRSLRIEAQERLVDIYFRGQRMALLGRNEPGPWVTSEEYFAPFQGRSAIFTHDWPLVGRDSDVEKVVEALGNGADRFTLLFGPGGIGKTRILKEAIARFVGQHRGTLVRFLSTSQEPSAASLAALGVGRKLLVVDDAHDREGLKLLVEYAVNEGNQTKLLIASRPYAEQTIRNELALYGIAEPQSITLDRLDRGSLRKLVVDVLTEFGGDPGSADAILAAASDSPLVAAMAARVVAEEGLAPELARGETKLRRFILSRFTNVITGHLGAPSDAPLLRAVLEVIALIQPFHIDDRRVAELVQGTRPSIQSSDAGRALKLLVDGGVLYKRGTLYRLMPDLLGDFLIEDTCIGADGRLADFAIAVADHVEADRLTQVLVNLGRTDWRMADGDPSNSQRLEPIWQTLRAIDEPHDGRIAAVEAVAYYQPAQALLFVQAQIEHGRILREFGSILKRVAYSPEHRRDALGLLWDLGQTDDRDTNPHPAHPIRILADLIGYDEYKPVSFNEEVAEFGFELLEKPDVWSRRYTPFDILKPLLSGEGMTTRSTGRGISMSPFLVEYDVVAKLRARLIDRIIELLESDNERAAFHAARMIEDSVRSPYGMMNNDVPAALKAKYENEFSETIARIASLLTKGTLAPTTIIRVIRSLNWYAKYGRGLLHDQVSKLFRMLPADLDFRFHAAIAEGAEYTFVGQTPFDSWSREQEWRTAFVTELLAAYPDRNVLCDALVARLKTVKSVGMSVFPAAQLVNRMVNADPRIGATIIERSLSDPDTILRTYLGHAVGAVFETQPDQGRSMIARMIEANDPEIRMRGAEGLIGLRRPYDRLDIDLLTAGLSSAHLDVASNAVKALQNWRDMSAREAVPLLLCVEFGEDAALFDDVAAALTQRFECALEEMDPIEVDTLLKRMKTLRRLDDFWVGELLTRLAPKHGLAVADFLLDRADIALAKKDGEDYRAVGFGHRGGGLALEASPDISAILERVWRWLGTHDDVWPRARYSIGETVAAMFKLDSPPVVEFLNTMLERATAGDLEWIGRILHKAHHTFVITQRRFVEAYLNRCKAVEPRLVDLAIDQLGSAAVSGSWSGTVGEPMPRDVEARDASAAILASMSRLSPAYKLYRRVHENAQQNIARTLAEAAAFDEED
ncbi:helix-turn-helix domain-containing protein (plasmid) [Rhizobium etli bv. mimosae str. IE4771]|uniref:Helix-turn-helix domain-containing protein n=1 Tax=Rhizobium etli bv. mimosae str. IE4771 TaxID=1432050 RepID=A0A060II82_RHIET|nr:helix-turn-helix domain-containing protein [Rhizobium sp. IE4771]AIC31306.1 helix-turn-helix domain-containing protein [Rhizobium sp. IE4771]